MIDPRTKVQSSEPARVRLTQQEWTTIIYCAAVTAGLGAIGAVLVRVAGADLVRAVIFGLGAAAVALLASLAVVNGFRRMVVRTTKPGAAHVDGRYERMKNRRPGSGRQLKGVDLRDAHLIDARLGASDLVDARLDGANLSYAYLDRALLTGACFADAVLHHASLESADLRDADLRRADLTRAQLSGADLSNAQLQGAILRDANLENATLVDADLRRVVFAGASLKGANIRGADLRGVSPLPGQLDAEQLEEAVTDAQPGFSRSVKDSTASPTTRARSPRVASYSLRSRSMPSCSATRSSFDIYARPTRS